MLLYKFVIIHSLQFFFKMVFYISVFYFIWYRFYNNKKMWVSLNVIRQLLQSSLGGMYFSNFFAHLKKY